MKKERKRKEEKLEEKTQSSQTEGKKGALQYYGKNGKQSEKAGKAQATFKREGWLALEELKQAGKTIQ